MQSIEILIVIVLIQYHALPFWGQPRQDADLGDARSTRFKMTVCKRGLQPMKKKKRRHAGYTPRCTAYLSPQKRRLLVVFGFQDFTTTIEAVRADVVTQVGFTGRRLDTQLWGNQEIVRTVHTALRRGLLVLLNGHDDS
jgi:hypothetical protein